jgi:hypothetical protein
MVMVNIINVKNAVLSVVVAVVIVFITAKNATIYIVMAAVLSKTK